MSMSLWNCHGYCCILFFFLMKAKEKCCHLIFCPLVFCTQSGQLDQNKLKKTLWTFSVFSLSHPLHFNFCIPSLQPVWGEGGGLYEVMDYTALTSILSLFLFHVLSLPSFCSLIFSRCECVLPNYPYHPLAVSHLPCNYGNLGNIIMLHKKRFLFSQQSRAVEQTHCSVISICFNVISL